MSHDDNHHPTGPGEGAQAPRRYAADPAAVLHPDAHARISRELLTTGRGGLHLGSGDVRPPVMRPGADTLAKRPSRMGDTLRWPDGRITHISEDTTP
jgi:hypothetical protein